MTARIARGSPPRRAKAPQRSAPRGKPRKAKRQSLADQLGVSAETVRRAAWWSFLGLAAAGAITAISAYQVPQLVGTAMAEAVGDAGFAVRRVEVRGLERMARFPVYEIALDQHSMAMPLVDLEATRQRLLRFGWIADARVSRRLPDTLVIDIVERRPAAIWQHAGRLMLIDREGVELEPVRIEAMPDLPLVIGADAHRQTAVLGRLLEAVPHLRPQVEGASWIGGRRWDLSFQSGEVLSLPEGEEAALAAIRSFARMDQQSSLLGREFVRFDMRIPGRFIVRVSREPGSAVPAIAPEAPPPTPGTPDDLANTI
jgi:cell division protein FtsQ